MKIMLREEKSRVAIAGLLFGVLALVFQISMAGATPLDDRIKAFQDAPKQTENEVLAVLHGPMTLDELEKSMRDCPLKLLSIVYLLVWEFFML